MPKKNSTKQQPPSKKNSANLARPEFKTKIDEAPKLYIPEPNSQASSLSNEARNNSLKFYTQPNWLKFSRSLLNSIVSESENDNAIDNRENYPWFYAPPNKPMSSHNPLEQTVNEKGKEKIDSDKSFSWDDYIDLSHWDNPETDTIQSTCPTFFNEKPHSEREAEKPTEPHQDILKK